MSNAPKILICEFTPLKVKVLFEIFWSPVGLDGVGKTTLLYQLKYSKFIETTPTFGFNLESILIKNLPHTFWDIGSSDPILQFHHQYLKNTKAIVFVVDASDRERIGNSRWMLRKLRDDPNFEELPLIVIGNKIDEQNAMGREEIFHGLSLSEISEVSV